MNTMRPMTHKERIDAVLTRRPVDRTPFCLVDGGAWIAKQENLSYRQMYALVDGGAWIAKQENLSYRQMYALEDGGASLIVKWTDEVETDFVSAVSGVFTACLNAFGCPIHIDEPGRPTDTGAVFTNPEEEIPRLDKGKIRETLLANAFVQGMLRQCRAVKELAGERKYLLGDIAGPFTMAAVMVGTQDFIMLMMDEPELTERLLDFTTCVSTDMFRLLHENGCDIAMPAEPVASGSLISQGMLEEWAIPPLCNLKNMLSDYKYFLTHVCGTSGARVRSLREAGVSAFSWDDLVDLRQALDDADNQMVIMGNINPAGALLTGTAAEVYAENPDGRGPRPYPRAGLRHGRGDSAGECENAVQGVQGSRPTPLATDVQVLSREKYRYAVNDSSSPDLVLHPVFQHKPQPDIFLSPQYDYPVDNDTEHPCVEFKPFSHPHNLM